MRQSGTVGRGRGVVEHELRAKDWRGFELTDSAGKSVMYVEWPTDRVTQADIDGLWDKLDEIDPPPAQLRLVRH